MTALKYRKLHVVLGYIQAIGCSLLCGFIGVKALTGTLSPVSSILSTLFLLFMIVISYIEVTRLGRTIMKIFTTYIYRIPTKGENHFQCFSMVCFFCLLIPLAVMRNNYPAIFFLIICIIAYFIIGIRGAMPDKISEKLIVALEADLPAILHGKANIEQSPKTVEDVISHTQKDLFENYSLN